MLDVRRDAVCNVYVVWCQGAKLPLGRTQSAPLRSNQTGLSVPSQPGQSPITVLLKSATNKIHVYRSAW